MNTHFDSKDFRGALGMFSTGVTVITTSDGYAVKGMTANAFTSVSLEPPLVLVCVAKKAQTHAYLEKNKTFGINILRESQQELSGHFAGKCKDSVEEQIQYDYHEDIPIIRDCLASLACTLWRTYDGGDHTLFVGEVKAIQMDDGDPLLFYKGAYKKII
ncbi:flavin reductase family protein [Paenibacillus naphthalenovorans]|uniref:flavin reductase family protein n=1 Tax=Paenibacillus naphthalenovorans TaxID=162209 RepID=UPI003D2BF0E6